ncbi:MAG: PEGA domain-containing protein [Patescibacteria group bacterium]
MIGKRFLIFITIVFAILGSTYLVIQLAKGYKPDLGKKTFLPTGLLVATSIPDGAQVWLNNQLKSATNTTISLSPGTYEVEIKKDGFIPWKKTLKIEKELVVKTDAYLFPQVSDLKALTFTGAQNPVFSPDGTKIVYSVSGAEVDKNGLWVLDLSELPFGQQWLPKEPRQIVRSVLHGRDFSKSTYKWSPDSKQILVSLPSRHGLAVTEKLGKTEENFLVDVSVFTTNTQLVDVFANLTTIQRLWEKEAKERGDQKLKKLPQELLKIIQGSSQDIVFAPDETKILYTATASANISENLIPALPAASTQKQERTIKVGQTYVYDIKEDRNFWIAAEGANIAWFPTSKHLIQVEKEKIIIMEYDGTNRTVVYSGPYEFPFAFPFPAGNKILILTALGKDLPLNLYAISLR